MKRIRLSTASAVDHRIPKNYLHLLLFNRLSTASAVDHRIKKYFIMEKSLIGLSTASAVDHRIQIKIHDMKTKKVSVPLPQ